MMLRILLSISVLSLMCTGILNAQTQNNRDSQSNTGLDLNFSNSFGGYYYQDGLLAITGLDNKAYAGTIDLDGYILGTNDIISIEIKANQSYVFRGLLINPNGEVILPNIGSVSLSGLSLKLAEDTVLEEASEVFNDPEISVTLEKARPLSVNISGGIPYPGQIVLPPFSRADLAAYLSIFDIQQEKKTEDETDTEPVYIRTSDLLRRSNYSLRNVKISRNDGSTIHADLITYFRTGDLSVNPVIQAGDQITINRLTERNSRIGISGSVQNPVELEYLASDTPQSLISIAGGFLPDADTTRLIVYRNTGSTIQKTEIPRSQWDRFDPQPNDRIIIPENDQINESASAWVYGEVDLPGNFPVMNGQTSAFDLLQLAGELKDEALPSAAYLIRGGTVENEIPNKFNVNLMKRTSDQLAQGFEYLDLETRLSRDRVFIDLEDEDQLKGVKIYDGDRLYVPRDENTVFVFGQVNNPGYFPYTPIAGTEVMDFIRRAGGFALSADRERVFIIKAGSGTWYQPNETELESGDRIFVDREPYDELNAQRTFEIQKGQLRNQRTQLILTAITTVTGIITTYVAIQNIRN